jgi:hypothetical protein
MVKKLLYITLFFILAEIAGIMKTPVCMAQGLPQFLQQMFGFVDDSFKFRGNRWEGIKSRIDISGERLEFLSALMDYEATNYRDLKDRLFIGFFSSGESKVRIIVRERAKNYWMKPVENRKVGFFKCKDGFNKFTWPDRIIKYHKISLRKLYGLAKTQSKGYEIIMPMILSKSEPLGTITVKEYKFIFLSNGEVDIDYRFIKVQGNKKIYQSSLTGQQGRILITWNGMAQNGQPVEDGDYLLSFDATFHYRDKPKKVLHFVYKFRHQSKINTR